MSDETAAPEIQINVKGPSELKLQITINTDKTVLELKQAIAEKSDVEAERQRLIYSGRGLKGKSPGSLLPTRLTNLPRMRNLLSVYKIQSSHTIHMVKGAVRSGAASTSAAPAASQPLPTMQTGQNPHDPLTQLNSHLGFGAMAGLNPFADMGLNPNDPNMLQGMMNNPQFLQQMSAMMSNPAIMDQIMASNPQMTGAQDGVPPPSLRPGIPGQTPSAPAAAPAAPAFPNLFGGGAGAGGAPPAFDPALLAALMGSAPPGSPSTAGRTPAAGAAPDLGAFYQNLLGAGAAPAPPADSRPPEERFQVQLQQLQDMGFTNASQNVRALLATGGNVHSAIEYILNGGGI
ncbi:hypothetical protein B0H14DRAFT_2730619 [Mycena olivaceomarginata]|nr:hypothetical protein B0H14DRAFT_2730619 [Mycena olivaceomarginata]